MNNDKTQKNELQQNNVKKHMVICQTLQDIYRAKNSDYGDSFSDTYKSLGLVSAVTRIADKTNRLINLSKDKEEQQVEDETIDDTLFDLANYCIMTLMQRKDFKTTDFYADGKIVHTEIGIVDEDKKSINFDEELKLVDEIRRYINSLRLEVTKNYRLKDGTLDYFYLLHETLQLLKNTLERKEG